MYVHSDTYSDSVKEKLLISDVQLMQQVAE